MRKVILGLLMVVSFVTLTSCEKNEIQDDNIECGKYNNNTLFKGSRGGCYYINTNGNKTYVDSQYCSCN